MQTPSSPRQIKFPKIKIAILLSFVLLVEDIVLISIFASSPHVQQAPSLLAFYAISFSAILSFWVYYDSRSLNISMGMDQAMYIFWGWPIMFPIYAFRSRGFRSGSLLLISFLGLFIFILVVAVIAVIVLTIGMTMFSLRQ